MALGKRRRGRQLEAFVVASDLPRSPGHPFDTALSQSLAANGFDPLVEKLCAPYYAETMGRPGVQHRVCVSQLRDDLLWLVLLPSF